MPFLFMMLPLFSGHLISADERYLKYLIFGVCVLGLIFSVRSLVFQFEYFSGLLGVRDTGELYYFANMPTVQFACLFFLYKAFQAFLERVSVQRFFLMVGFCLASFVAVLPMALTLQRASLGVVLVYVCCLFLYAFYKKPYKSFILILGVGIGAVFMLGFVSETVFDLLNKTSSVGFNMRFEELSAVWESVSKDPFSLIFGLGWGGTFNSPAVGELSVNFTHSLLTSLILKTGLLGFVLGSCYIGALFFRCLRVHRSHLFLVMALAFPILIDVFLYASFKSLDFGLILLVFSCLPLSINSLQTKPSRLLHR